MRLLRALSYSLLGLKSTWKSEAAFRLEIWLLSAIVPMALFLAEDTKSALLLIAIYILLPTVELINSSIESAINLYGNEHNALAGKAKDQGSAAVLLTLIVIILLWITILTL